jgi:hypothetical protein
MKNLLVAVLLIAGSSALACDSHRCKVEEPKEDKEIKIACQGGNTNPIGGGGSSSNCKAPKEEAKLACGQDGKWGGSSCKIDTEDAPKLACDSHRC